MIIINAADYNITNSFKTITLKKTYEILQTYQHLKTISLFLKGNSNCLPLSLNSFRFFLALEKRRITTQTKLIQIQKLLLTKLFVNLTQIHELINNYPLVSSRFFTPVNKATINASTELVFQELIKHMAKHFVFEFFNERDKIRLQTICQLRSINLN